jgi:RND family efflux transporter MFP subunit
MNTTSRVVLRWPVFLVVAIACMAAGAAGTYWIVRSPARPAPAGADHAISHDAPQAEPHENHGAATASDRLADVHIELTPEAMERAGIVVATVAASGDGAQLRLPASIEPNEYKQVDVTPLVSGRVTRVLAQLGGSVHRGQALAEIFSPDLAEAETRYVSARAELDAHERQLQRTEKLVEIGAATRQEVEMLHAEHTARLTAVASAQSRLELLGLSSAQIGHLGPGTHVAALMTIPAPLAGIVTARTANPGLNVDTTAKLFTIVDLSSVWVIAGVYEKDFARLRAGARATVTTTAYPGLVIPTRVTYIDPRVSPETRTARVRAEVPNPRGLLRLGMYAEMSIDDAGDTNLPTLPASAVQNVGDRTVVYLLDDSHPGRFTEREVRLGERSGDRVAVIEGVKAGDAVVTKGTFSLRAERERLGLRATSR